MFDLLKILLFGNAIILTPQSITIDKNHSFLYKEKLNIVTNGASVKIDISNSTKISDLSNISLTDSDKQKKLSLFLLQCPIEIFATDSDSGKRVFFNKAYMSFSKGEKYISFGYESFEDHKNIQNLTIQSTCTFDNVKIMWKNYSL